MARCFTRSAGPFLMVGMALANASGERPLSAHCGHQTLFAPRAERLRVDHDGQPHTKVSQRSPRHASTSFQPRAFKPNSWILIPVTVCVGAIGIGLSKRQDPVARRAGPASWKSRDQARLHFGQRTAEYDDATAVPNNARIQCDERGRDRPGRGTSAERNPPLCTCYCRCGS